MKQSTRLVLAVLVFLGAHFANAHQDGDGDVASTDSPDVDEQNGTDQSNGNRAGRIAGGTPATSANQPYSAIIKVTSGVNMISMVGAVISNTEVLTSASALLRAGNVSVIKVFVGSNPSVFAAKSFNYKSYELHVGFISATQAKDVAIITINGTFAGTLNVQPIAIASAEIATSTANRTKCVVLGYGQYADGSDSAVLNQVDYELLTDAECAAGSPIPPSIMCAKPAGIGYACTLDSGAPLVCNGQLYGILTDQSSCTVGNAPTSQKFAKLPAINIPWNTASTSTSNATVPAAPRKNYVSCP